jgi:phage terminase large subunit GpA-like protein
MDCFSDPLVERVVVMASGQFGKTEDVLNVAGCYMENDPAPILIVRPTEDEAKAFTKDRFAAMVRDTPSLHGLILEPRVKGSDNTLFHKKFIGGHVTITWSGSQAGVASRPIRICLCDEIDLYEVDAVSKAIKRTARFWNRKIGLFSTPTYSDTSTIEGEFNASDRRYPHVPCPLCGEFQKLDWEHVQWTGGDPDTAVYICAHCSRAWTDHQRARALRDAIWKAEGVFKGVAGFSGWEIHYPGSKLSKMVDEFLKAKHRRDMGDPDPLMNWTNLTLGKSWSLRGKTVPAEPLMERRENYSPSALPYRILYLTAGVDVQDNRIEAEIVGWRREKRNDIEESWGCEYISIYGDPAKAEIWAELDEILKREWTTEDGRQLRLGAVCIDSGGHHTEEVYRFCNNKVGRHIYAIKGMDGARKIWTPRATKSKRYKGSLLWLVGVETAKARIYNHLRVETHGPGYCHFPLDYSSQYFKDLVSEEIRTKYFHGKAALYFFLPPGKRNEPLDIRGYALAALESRSIPWEILTRSAPTEPPAPKDEGPEDDGPKTPRTPARLPPPRVSPTGGNLRPVRYRIR